MRMLLLAGAAPNARSDDGLFSPLHLAVDYGHYEIAHYILKEGKSSDSTYVKHHVVTDRRGQDPTTPGSDPRPSGGCQNVAFGEPGSIDDEIIGHAKNAGRSFGWPSSDYRSLE